MSTKCKFHNRLWMKYNYITHLKCIVNNVPPGGGGIGFPELSVGGGMGFPELSVGGGRGFPEASVGGAGRWHCKLKEACYILLHLIVPDIIQYSISNK